MYLSFSMQFDAMGQGYPSFAYAAEHILASRKPNHRAYRLLGHQMQGRTANLPRGRPDV